MAGRLCFAYTWRKFVEAQQVQPWVKSGKANWAIANLKNLYRIEAEIKARAAEEKQASLVYSDSMKTRFLDKRNCHALLPPTEGLPVLQRLEECLKQINDAAGPHQGIIDQLIKHNQKSDKLSYGSKRFLPAAIDIAHGLDFETRVIRTGVYERPGNAPIRLHIIYENSPNIGWKIILPLQFLLKGWGDANAGYQGYIHTICHDLIRVESIEDFIKRQSSDQNDYYYVGLTGRNWLQRLSEHVREVRNGGRRRFYQAWRNSIGIENVLIVSSLMDVNLSFEDAMNWEEHEVDRIATGPNGLNMIPGGFKGRRELHKLGLLSKESASIEEYNSAIDEYVRKNPRKGIPNPFIAEYWKKDSHYGKVIGGREKSLTIEQIQRIREPEKRAGLLRRFVRR